MGVAGAAVLVTLTLAFAANLALDIWQVAGSSTGFGRHRMTDEPGVFLLGAFVVWLFVVVIVVVLGRLWVSVWLVATVTVLLGYANYRKLQLVREPLYPSDLDFLSNPGFVMKMAGPEAVAALVVGAAAALGIGVLTGRLAARRFPRLHRRSTPRLTWLLLGARCVAAVAAVVTIASLAQFHHSGNWARQTYDSYGAHWRPWHQRLNYTDNGFVGGMLYNLPLPAMAAPPGYGEATMRRLVSKYVDAAERINVSRGPARVDDANVVLVLGEAFSDPMRVDGVELAEDPIPFTRALMRRTTAGNMWSPDFGGGTANVEFEVLTGLSLAQFRPQMSTPYQMLVPDHETFPSAARVLERRGLGSLAMHSYTAELYRRPEVYPILGFDETVFVDEMRHTDTVDDNPFVSDRATYEEVLTRLDETEPPMFVHTVTMQNHYPMAGKYDDPIEVTRLSDEAARTNLEHYARGLRHSDDAMRSFIGALERSPEKTVVVFYGDHLPALWSPSSLTHRTAHETPFFVYANFGRQEHERLPTTSPIHFMNHVLEVTDAPVSPYYALLHQLEQQIPAMGQTTMIGPDNQELASADLSGRARRLLRDYRLVQYDLAVGERYGLPGLFAPVTDP